MEFKIEGTIQISLVPMKTRTRCLKKIVSKRHHFISSKTNVLKNLKNGSNQHFSRDAASL
jgi:hypothetical protein